MQTTRREFLGIYILAKPKTETEEEHNKEMLAKAEAIKSIRVQQVINEEFGFLDKGGKNGKNVVIVGRNFFRL